MPSDAHAGDGDQNGPLTEPASSTSGPHGAASTVERGLALVGDVVFLLGQGYVAFVATLPGLVISCSPHFAIFSTAVSISKKFPHGFQDSRQTVATVYTVFSIALYALAYRWLFRRWSGGTLGQQLVGRVMRRKSSNAANARRTHNLRAIVVHSLFAQALVMIWMGLGLTPDWRWG